ALSKARIPPDASIGNASTLIGRPGSSAGTLRLTLAGADDTVAARENRSSNILSDARTHRTPCACHRAPSSEQSVPMSKPVHAAREAACQIRFGQVGLAQLRIHTTDPDALLSELTARIAAAPQLFERAGICLDLSTLERQAEADEVRTVLEVVRAVGMLPVGLTEAGDGIDAL